MLILVDKTNECLPHRVLFYCKHKWTSHENLDTFETSERLKNKMWRSQIIKVK
jgi:hypothetical protein